VLSVDWYVISPAVPWMFLTSDHAVKEFSTLLTGLLSPQPLDGWDPAEHRSMGGGGQLDPSISATIFTIVGFPRGFHF
jgi:hypothetical protein